MRRSQLAWRRSRASLSYLSVESLEDRERRTVTAVCGASCNKESVRPIIAFMSVCLRIPGYAVAPSKASPNSLFMESLENHKCRFQALSSGPSPQGKSSKKLPLSGLAGSERFRQAAQRCPFRLCFKRFHPFHEKSRCSGEVGFDRCC